MKTRKNIYEHERMTLQDAINVLRVSDSASAPLQTPLTLAQQSVEVAAPNSTYEIVIKTAMTKGTTIPKGRYSLPREAKTQTRDRILVFAEGKQAEEARQAGADIVGGPELVDGVRLLTRPVEFHTHGDLT